MDFIYIVDQSHSTTIEVSKLLHFAEPQYDIVDQFYVLNLIANLHFSHKPEILEKVVGSVEIREIFRAPRVGTVAGCYVQSGSIQRNSTVRLIRDSVVIYESRISSLRRFKEDVREVQSGFECGLTVEGYQDIKPDDQIEVYETREVARQLETK